VSSPRQGVAGVSELVLEVSDLGRAEEFYSRELGLPVVERWPHRDAIWVLAGMTRIGLWRPQVGLEGSRGGVHVHEVPVHEFGPLGKGAANSRSAYVHDPDGHLVEFWTADMGDYGSETAKQ
jgi:catechol 2,3-dioxygenase-like lactoylglutathione lyase family enzyme